MAETSFLRYLNPFDFLPMLGAAAQLPPVIAGAGTSSGRPPTTPDENLPPAPLDEGPGGNGLPASATAALDRIRRGQTAGLGAGIRRPSPVVTPGEAALPTPPQQAAEGQSTNAAPPSADPSAEGNSPWDRLARFGFGMAASNNPSFFGQLGEAGLNMMRGDREARQDANKNRELDIMQEYRRAQIEVTRAENEWTRDPNNPRNVALLAEARYREAAAAAALRRGEGGGGGSADGQGIPMMGEDGRMTIFYPRSGRSVQAPEGLSMVGANANTPDERRYSAWGERRQRALSELLGPNSMIAGNQSEVERRMRVWDSMNPEPPRRRPATNGQPETTALPQSESNRVRIPFNSPR